MIMGAIMFFLYTSLLHRSALFFYVWMIFGVYVIMISVSGRVAWAECWCSCCVPANLVPHCTLLTHCSCIIVTFIPPQGALVSLLSQFKAWLCQFQRFWLTMELVDSSLWVLEPLQPTKAATSRRIVLGMYTLVSRASPSYSEREKGSGQKGRTNASGWNAIIDNFSVHKIETNRHFRTVCIGRVHVHTYRSHIITFH